MYLSKVFRSVYNYYYFIGEGLDSIKAQLKKCSNIRSVELGGPHYGDPEMVNQVFRLILENCNNLSEFIVLKHINDNNFEEFHQKFGPKIKYLRTLRTDRELIGLNRFPNIEKLMITSDNLYNVFTIPQLKLAKLKQLEIAFGHGQEHMLQTVIDNFPKLTHLCLVIDSEDENAFYRPLKNISNLKHLIHFKLFKKFGTNNNIFCDLLIQMANICQNLKSIECRLNIELKSVIRQLFSQLKAFPALKRLNLCLNFIIYEADEDDIDMWLYSDIQPNDVNHLFSFELFRGLSNITHLTLSFDSRQYLKELILKDIDINLPKLQYLKIEDQFDTTPEGVQQMADIVSRLSRLQKIQLKFKTPIDYKRFEEQITEKCRKIKEIKLSVI